MLHFRESEIYLEISHKFARTDFFFQFFFQNGCIGVWIKNNKNSIGTHQCVSPNHSSRKIEQIKLTHARLAIRKKYNQKNLDVMYLFLIYELTWDHFWGHFLVIINQQKWSSNFKVSLINFFLTVFKNTKIFLKVLRDNI